MQIEVNKNKIVKHENNYNASEMVYITIMCFLWNHDLTIMT